ncbi:MAG TPA: flagellar hook-basal body complex protein FliE [Candidatus Acidoferrales bacterium]|nr:flagellar hook-basal body complex protein FliE [Candidatus Acidoferrales bacterium]
MTVEPLMPDAAPALDAAPAYDGDAARFGAALDAVGGALDAAQRAEDDFAYGRGPLHEAMYARARAGVALSIATAAAQRTASAISSILNVQV